MIRPTVQTGMHFEGFRPPGGAPENQIGIKCVLQRPTPVYEVWRRYLQQLRNVPCFYEKCYDNGHSVLT